MSTSKSNDPNANRQVAPGQAPIDKTSPDGNVNRSEQKHIGNASPGGASSSEASRSTTGQHGGNHGNDSDNRNQPAASGQNAKGSSHAGARVPDDNRNQGGGQDSEKKQNQSQPKGESDYYANGSLSRSSANDGGTIDDSNNRDAK
ncbi:hypothetical protein [Hymenobacter sp. CRA2]|uniref:hypothetical protein n=1 Tax=Hymenobacter sp. CRA2 TaxID=1955620 RepID=UPI00099027DE|nr:hypothetical protein [Hymenobacter sp. CRA2]OON69635.1 hypothetical protein B0919_06780 [Hymenobacter sp. CRA2]